MKYIRRVWFILAGIIWVVAYFGFIIKLPFYIYINNISVPEECTQLETNVIISEFPTWQIVADRLVYTAASEEEIEEYIVRNNRYSKRIKVANLFERNNPEYDDYDIVISSEQYAYVEEEEKDNYIVLEYSSNMYGGYLFEKMCLIGIIIMIVICCLVYKVSKT